ncbi:MAG: DUF2905 domain-containing protein [candidate division WOR-3 bacterium]
MTELSPLGKFLILIGFFIIILGLSLILLTKIGIGHLPGDIMVKRSNFTFYFPLMSSIIISLLLTLILNLFLRK